MATYQNITLVEMSQFIDGISHGKATAVLSRKQSEWVGTGEYVYEWPVAPQLTLRVYSSVTAQGARASGGDAVRVVLLAEGIRQNAQGSSEVVMISLGKHKRVHRVTGWRDNLTRRINEWPQWVTPQCPRCLAYTVQRVNHVTKVPFYGCVRWPLCPGSVSSNG